MAGENKEKRKDIYVIFNDFLKKTVVEKKSYFPDNANEEVFKKEDALSELVDRYVNNFIGDEKSEKGKDLLKKLKDNESDPKKKKKLN